MNLPDSSLELLDPPYNRESLECQMEYWKLLLKDAPSLELPTDKPRSALPLFNSGTEPFNLSMDLTEGLKALSQREGVTLFMTLVSAFQVLLHRYSGQDDIVIGTPIAVRSNLELEGLIGYFINTLVLRTDLSGDPSFCELLARVRVVALDAYANQDMPFKKLVEDLNPQRDPSRHPLFQVMFVFQNTTEAKLQLNEISVDALKVSSATTKFDLTLELSETLEGLTGSLEYATDLFDAPTITRLIGHYQTLLEGIIARPEARLSELPLLTKPERQQLLVNWNETYRDYPKNKCIHQLFEEQVERTPDAIALVFEDQQLSYQMLNTKANQFAHYLRGIGVGPDSLVGICLDRGIDMIVGLFAILKAGGAYVPLDSSYPKERLALMLADSKPVALLLNSENLLQFSDQSEDLKLICLDAITAPWLQLPYSNLNSQHIGLHSEHLAYVIYTSGSTGQPKGVAMPHGALVNLISWQMKNTRVNSTARTLQYSPISFDVSFQEIFATVCGGGGLILVDELTRHDPLLLLKHLDKNRIERLYLPFIALEQIARSALSNSFFPDSLREVVTAGEQLRITSEIRGFFAGLNDCQLANQYGPTETHVVTAFALPLKSTEWETLPPIGRPIANTRIYILDSNGEPVPEGIQGELYIGGACVARGYLNRPELTAERFLIDPYVGEPSARMYKTGDLARWRAEGVIEFLGRNDFQVKIRGFRIELGDIEETLRQHPRLREVVVGVYESVPGDKRLAAYLVAEDGFMPSISELREFIKRSMPEYMVPSAYVFLAALPITPNGKLNRKALPEPNSEAYAAHAYEEPQGETEKTLAQFWAELLNVERVGRQDNFFELGGHSLLMVMLIENMRSTGLHADLAALLSAPSLAEMATAVGGGTKGIDVQPNLILPDCEAITPEMLPLVSLEQTDIDRIVASVPGGAANVQDIYPLAPLQEGILFHHLMESEGDTYLLSSMLAFDTRKSLDSFLAAFQAVIVRQDILRTAMAWEGLPEPVQVVWREAFLPVEEVVLDTWAGDAASQLTERFDSRHYRIDLRAAPLIRAFVAHDEAHERWLLPLLIHHLLADHTTLEILLEEIKVHQLGQADRLPSPQPYRNFVAQARHGMKQEEHEAFFRQMLGDVDESTAPFGMLDVRNDGSSIKKARLRLDEDLALRIRNQARALRVSTASVFHLAWAQVLARVSAREDVVFGTVLFGRMHSGEGADRAMGLFINTLPVRIHVDDCSVADCMRQTHELLAGLLRHENAQLALAQRCSAVTAPAPLFTALLNYRHNQDITLIDQNDGALERGFAEFDEQERTNYPTVLSVDDFDKGFLLTAQTQLPVEPERMCIFMLTALENLIEALEVAPDNASRAVEVLPADERRRLLEEFNDTEAPFPKDKCIHHLFEDQVSRSPEAVAVAYQDQQITYKQLNAYSNQLAHYLRSLGVGPEVLVAICLERSIDMVVGLLAILKAGGAYVPLDPVYPKERLVFMLEDSSPLVLLTQGRYKTLFTGMPKCPPMIDVSAESYLWEKQPSTNPSHSVVGLGSENLVYVIYTSGSTGKPKASCIVHRGLQNLIAWYKEVTQITSDDSILVVSTIAFDLTQKIIFAPLLSGARLILAGEPFDSQEIVALVVKEGISMINMTPSGFYTLIDVACNKELNGLRLVVLGGEPMLPLRLLEISEPRPQFINIYGPTECTSSSTFYCLDSDLEQYRNRSVPIGRPISNARIYILDRYRNLVPVGVTGEIYIGGVPVGRGYLNQPELTAERFLIDPFTAETDAKIYKTGDLARWLPDSTIEYQGRNDFQVKIRGFRIELGEIEFVLKEHPKLREVVVSVYEPILGDKRLAAYVVPEKDSIPSISELREFLKKTLSDYMIPSAFVILDALPLTPNGKLDRKALPEPNQHQHDLGIEFIAPRNSLEKQLTKIWGDLLKIDHIGIHDNFFELGGHSLLAVKMIVDINKLFNTSIPLVSIYQYPTIEALGTLISSGTPKSSSYSLVPIQTHGFRPKLFAIHTISLHDLPQYLGKDQPLYFLRYGIVGEVTDNSLNLPQLEDLASHYIMEMQQLQSCGPYYLIGFSFGGVIAYEMACQLVANGHKVNLVGLLDTYLIEEKKYRLPLHLIIYKLLTLSPKELFLMGINKIKYSLTPKNDSTDFSPHVYTLGPDQMCRSGYQPKKYDGNVTLFQAYKRDSMFFSHAPPEKAWRKILGNKLEVKHVSGTHQDILKNPILAEEILNYMDKSIEN